MHPFSRRLVTWLLRRALRLRSRSLRQIRMGTGSYCQEPTFPRLQLWSTSAVVEVNFAFSLVTLTWDCSRSRYWRMMTAILADSRHERLKFLSLSRALRLL